MTTEMKPVTSVENLKLGGRMDSKEGWEWAHTAWRYFYKRLCGEDAPTGFPCQIKDVEKTNCEAQTDSSGIFENPENPEESIDVGDIRIDRQEIRNNSNGGSYEGRFAFILVHEIAHAACYVVVDGEKGKPPVGNGTFMGRCECVRERFAQWMTNDFLLQSNAKLPHMEEAKLEFNKDQKTLKDGDCYKVECIDCYSHNNNRGYGVINEVRYKADSIPKCNCVMKRV